MSVAHQALHQHAIWSLQDISCRSMSSKQLYRQLLRAAKDFPVQPVGRKIAYNCRELFDWYRREKRKEELQSLHGDAHAALRVIGWMRTLPEVVRVTSLHTYLLS
jgi:Complex 1 protein (LYR family)